MESVLVILAPLLIILIALSMVTVENYVVTWKPKSVDQNGEVDLHLLADELSENNQEVNTIK